MLAAVHYCFRMFYWLFLSILFRSIMLLLLKLLSEENLNYKQFAFKVSLTFLPSNNKPPSYILLFTEHIVKALCILYVYFTDRILCLCSEIEYIVELQKLWK